MDRLLALAVSVGALVALWVKVGAMASLAVPGGVIAWACFFAAGGKTQGLQKAIASNLSGVVWVWIAMALVGTMNLGSFSWIVFGVVAFMLVIQSKLAALSFIPGALRRGGDGVGDADRSQRLPHGGGRAGCGRGAGLHVGDGGRDDRQKGVGSDRRDSWSGERASPARSLRHRPYLTRCQFGGTLEPPPPTRGSYDRSCARREGPPPRRHRRSRRERDRVVRLLHLRQPGSAPVGQVLRRGPVRSGAHQDGGDVHRRIPDTPLRRLRVRSRRRPRRPQVHVPHHAERDGTVDRPDRRRAQLRPNRRDCRRAAASAAPHPGPVSWWRIWWRDHVRGRARAG